MAPQHCKRCETLQCLLAHDHSLSAQLRELAGILREATGVQVDIPDEGPVPSQSGIEIPPLWTLGAARQVDEDEMAGLLGATQRVIQL